MLILLFIEDGKNDKSVHRKNLHHLYTVNLYYPPHCAQLFCISTVKGTMQVVLTYRAYTTVSAGPNQIWHGTSWDLNSLQKNQRVKLCKFCSSICLFFSLHSITTTKAVFSCKFNTPTRQRIQLPNLANIS